MSSQAWLRIGVITLAFVLPWTQAGGKDPGAGGPEDLDVEDLDELDALGEDAPEAVDDFAELRSAWAAVELERAAEIAEALAATAPEVAVIARSQCALLLEMDRPELAMAACERAVTHRRSAKEVRTWMSAFVVREHAPSQRELARAFQLLETALQANPDDPRAQGARCDLAKATGDEVMYHEAHEVLTSVAPDHPETGACAASAPLSWRLRRPMVMGGWIVLALGGLASLGLAAAKALRSHGRLPDRAVAGVVLALAVATVPDAAHATRIAPDPETVVDSAEDEPSPLPWPIDDADPIGSLPTPEEGAKDVNGVAELIHTYLERAEGSLESGDGARAERYYAALAYMRPEAALTHRGLCAALRMQGKRSEARAACSTAVRTDGAEAGDIVALVELLMETDEPLRPEDEEEAEAALAHLISELPDDPSAYRLQCELALRLEDDDLLAACTEKLGTLAPDDSRTTVFRWAAAVRYGDFDQAERLADLARIQGVDPSGVERMDAQVEALRPLWARIAKVVAIALVVVMSFAAGTALARRARRRNPVAG